MVGDDAKLGVSFKARFYYDAIYKRDRIIEDEKFSDDEESYDVLSLYNNQTQYVVNLKTKECRKLPLTRPWVDFGVSQNATFLGESYLGSSAVTNGSLLVTIWKDQTSDGSSKIIKKTFHFPAKILT